MYKEQVDIEERPYNIWIAELPIHVYEGDDYLKNSDYIINENYYFRSLEEVLIYLKERNLLLSDIKWSSELEFL